MEDDDDEFDAEKMMAKAQKQAQSAKAQEQKQEHQVAKRKAQRAMEILRTLSWEKLVGGQHYVRYWRVFFFNSGSKVHEYQHRSVINANNPFVTMTLAK